MTEKVSSGNKGIIGNTATGENTNTLYADKLIHTYILEYILVKEKKKRGNRSIYIDLELWDIFRDRCKSLKVSMSDILEHLIMLFIEATNSLPNIKTNKVSIDVSIRKINRKTISKTIETSDDGLPIVSASYIDGWWLTSCPKCNSIISLDHLPDPRNIEVCLKCKSEFHIKPMPMEAEK